MKKEKITIIIVAVLLVLLLAGAGVVLFFGVQNLQQVRATEIPEPEGTKSELNGVRTFEDWTDEEVFKTVPAMLEGDSKIGSVVHYGDENYVIDVNYTTLNDYQSYIKILEQVGYQKFADNGETGVADTVYTTTCTKDDVAVTVTFISTTGKTYISAKTDQPLSEHLLYKDEYVKGNKVGAKTKVHMLDMYDFGNSFIIQLKNGHFILNDGGVPEDLPYLITYLEKLVPEGEKPVIEAWIFSHAHMDHGGVFWQIMTKPEYAERVYVEEVFYNVPNRETSGKFDATTVVTTDKLVKAVRFWKTTKGTAPKMYRPVTGQRYYFSDISIEVVLSQDQMLFDQHLFNYNDTSTWLMYNIEGQKFLLAGDADLGGIQQVMRIYDKSYFEVDIMAVFHHGINVYDVFTDFITYKTAVYPTIDTDGPTVGVGSAYIRPEQNKKLRDKALEQFSWGDGPKVMTFPYKVGSVESLPPTQFDNNGERSMY